MSPPHVTPGSPHVPHRHHPRSVQGPHTRQKRSAFLKGSFRNPAAWSFAYTCSEVSCSILTAAGWAEDSCLRPRESWGLAGRLPRACVKLHRAGQVQHHKPHPRILHGGMGVCPVCPLLFLPLRNSGCLAAPPRPTAPARPSRGAAVEEGVVVPGLLHCLRLNCFDPGLLIRVGRKLGL